MKVLLALVLLTPLASPVAAQTTPAQAAPAQQKLGLNDPKVPIAPATAKQPADAVLDDTGIAGAKDKAPEDSPVSGSRHGAGLTVGSSVSMRLSASVNSGMVKNGDSIYGTLVAPVRTTAGRMLPAGTRVVGTVVSTAKAGTVQSAGELSLQLTRVGSVPVVTGVVDFNGRQGHKDVADAAPAKGTEAIARAGATLQFRVLENGTVPGIVPGAQLPKGAGAHGKGAGKPASLPSTGQPNTGPGVDQTPIHGGSQPPQTAGPGR